MRIRVRYHHPDNTLFPDSHVSDSTEYIACAVSMQRIYIIAVFHQRMFHLIIISGQLQTFHSVQLPSGHGMVQSQG